MELFDEMDASATLWGEKWSRDGIKCGRASEKGAVTFGATRRAARDNLANSQRGLELCIRTNNSSRVTLYLLISRPWQIPRRPWLHSSSGGIDFSGRRASG